MRTDRLQAAYEIEFQYTLFPLHPDTPDEGLTLEQLFAGRSFDIEAMQVRLAGLMVEEGLPYGQRTMTYNSRLAKELAKWAEDQGQGDAFHHAAFRAYFADGKNIARMKNLLDIVISVSLDPDEARKSIEERTYREAVDADWLRARQLGITAVPTFLFGEGRLVGAQPYEALKQFVGQG